MYSNTNFDPHLSALLFLGTVGSLLLLVIASVAFWFFNRRWLRYSLLAMSLLLVGYGVLLFGFSVFSRERTLARGQEKYFCELDCHLAYSVQKVERVKQIGDTVANGEFYVVTLRGRFDETTTAPWRPRDAALTPDPLNFTLVDTRGDAVPLSEPGQKAWDSLRGASPYLFNPIRPGESVEATFVFEAPPAMHSPRLLASVVGFPTPVLIGDEDSFLHRKTYFGL